MVLAAWNTLSAPTDHCALPSSVLKYTATSAPLWAMRAEIADSALTSLPSWAQAKLQTPRLMQRRTAARVGAKNQLFRRKWRVVIAANCASRRHTLQTWRILVARVQRRS